MEHRALRIAIYGSPVCNRICAIRFVTTMTPEGQKDQTLLLLEKKMHPKNICAPLLLNISVEHFQIVIKAAALTQMLLTTAFAIHFRETNITSLPHMILGRIYLVLMRQMIQSYGRTRRKKFCLRPLNPAMM